MRSVLLAGAFLGFVVFSSWSCAGANSSNCDPDTIMVKGGCYWDKTQACDAAGCPPRDRARYAFQRSDACSK